VHQTSQFLGAMANIGVRGSRAGTALSTALSRLSQAASGVGRTAKITNEQFSAFGLSIQDFRDKTGKVDLFKLIKSLSQFSERADFTGRVMRIFGEEAGRTFISLAKAPQILDDVIRKTKEFEGSAAEMEKRMMKGLPGAIKSFKSAFESLQISIVQSIKPALIPFTNALTSLMRGFSSLQPEIQTFISGVGIMAAVIGPLLITFSLLKPVLIGAVGAFKWLFLIMKKTTLLSAAWPLAIIAAIAVIMLAVDDLFAFLDGKQSVLGKILEINNQDLNEWRAIIKTIWGEFKWLFGRITDGWSKIFDFNSTEMFNAIDDLLFAIQKRIANALPKFVSKAMGLGDFINPELDMSRVGQIKNLSLPEMQFKRFQQKEATQSMITNNSKPAINTNINVSVGNGNASPEAIAESVNNAMAPELQKVVRQLRQISEPVYEN
jgi:hypothetical protein